MMALEDSDMDMINDIVESIERVVKTANPHLKGRLIHVLDIDSETSFKIMKRVKVVMYYYNPETRVKTPCLTVQEVMRIPSGETEVLMREFAKRFLVTAFMWSSSQIYKDLIDGKFESEQSADTNRESGS